MIPSVEACVVLAKAAHGNQKDKSGDPYFGHPLRVLAAMVRGGFPEPFQRVAILHDVLEDTKLTLNDLHRFGLPYEEISALILLTRKSKEPYVGYMARVGSNDIAFHVKIEDLKDNLRGNFPSLRKRYEKWLKAWGYMPPVKHLYF